MEKAHIVYGVKDVYDDPDLRMLIGRRVLLRFLTMIFEVSKRADNNQISAKQENLVVLMDKILEKEIEAFQQEFYRYQKKFKADPFEDIKKVREGKEGFRRALLHLLQWDRAWLKVDWVVEIILAAQDLGDAEFVKQIGDAIGKRPICDMKPKNRELYEKLKPFVDAHNFGDHEIKSIRGMHEFLTANGLVGDAFLDFDYFVRWLRRHNLILKADTKK